MKQIRIMELRGTYKGGGGPDKTILLSAAKHDRKRFFVLVTYLRDPKDDDFQIGDMARKYGVPDYVEVLDRSMLDFRCLFQLHSLLRCHKLTIIHVHDQKTTLLGFLLKILNPRIKVMSTAHGWIVNSRFDSLKKKIQLTILKSFPLHIAVSKATENLMLDAGFRPESIKMLYNSIDINTWKRTDGSGTLLKRELGIAPEAMVIGSIGRLSQEKDLITFLRVAKNILVKFPDIIFLIVGDGKGSEIGQELLNEAKSLAIEKSLLFLGHRTDLMNIYGVLDLFLMTSLTEGLPNTVLEAMAMEVPIVSTAVGGVPEIVEHLKTGTLCNVGDVEGITKSVEELLQNSLTRDKFTANGRALILEKFSFDGRLEAIEKIYVNLAER